MNTDILVDNLRNQRNLRAKYSCHADDADNADYLDDNKDNRNNNFSIATVISRCPSNPNMLFVEKPSFN